MELRDHLSAPLRLGILLNRVLPRGKGALPRWVGRRLKRDPKHSIYTRHGARLVVEPSSLDVYAHIVNHGRTWNWNVLAATAATLQPADVLYDIGANIGFVTLEIAGLFRSDQPRRGVRVVSFEPLPALAEAIRESAELNGLANVAVRNEIVSNFDGVSKFFLGSHTIHASLKARESGSRVFELPTTQIDALVASGKTPAPNVIKIDVEGGELACFQGAVETIKTHRPSILFESDENCVRFGYERRDVVSLLLSLGPYRFFRVADTGDGLEPLNRDETAAANPADVLATTAPDQRIAEMNEHLECWTASGRIIIDDRH